MFAKPISVGFGQQAVATLVATAVLLASIGFFATAEAANFVDVSNTLTDSDLSATAGHDIEFTVPTGSSIGTGNTVTITFPTEFTNVANVDATDVTVTVNAGAATPGAFDSTGQVISFNNITAAAGAVVRVVIAAGVVSNPNANGDYEFVISVNNAGNDTGKTRVYIIDDVLVTAIVETTFEFQISGLATSTTVNGDATTGSTESTLIPFGTLSAGVPEVLGQRLNVTTNANSGFVVTVETDGDLESSNGAIIDTFTYGTDVTTPTAWVNPVADVNDRTTWGHWGITSDDSDLAVPFGAGEYIAASTTPRLVFTHDGPSDGTTADIGEIDVAYQVEITSLQEAADDYQTTLTYIATPTF